MAPGAKKKPSIRSIEGFPHFSGVEDRGLEQMAFSSEKAMFSHSCAAECGAVFELRSVAAADDDLQTILDVWPDLDAATRALLIRIVEAELR